MTRLGQVTAGAVPVCVTIPGEAHVVQRGGVRCVKRRIRGLSTGSACRRRYRRELDCVGIVALVLSRAGFVHACRLSSARSACRSHIRHCKHSPALYEKEKWFLRCLESNDRQVTRLAVAPLLSGFSVSALFQAILRLFAQGRRPLVCLVPPRSVGLAPLLAPLLKS